MFGALLEREAETLERLTMVVANGSAIAWGGKEAYDAWRETRMTEDERREVDAARQADTIAFLSRHFPNAVKARTN